MGIPVCAYGNAIFIRAMFALNAAMSKGVILAEVPVVNPADENIRHPSLTILVRRDISQKTQRFVFAMHAAVVFANNVALWDHNPALDQYWQDWVEFPDHGPIIRTYGVDNVTELQNWYHRLELKLIPLVMYEEHGPGTEWHGQCVSLAFYGNLPAEHGLRLL